MQKIHGALAFRFITLVVLALFVVSPTLVFSAPTTAEKAFARTYAGRIVAETDADNENWYVDPVGLGRIYLGAPEEALLILTSLALGISNKDFANVPLEGESRVGNRALLRRLAGRVLIKVQDSGKTYYVNPVTYKAIPLATPDDAEKLINQRVLKLNATRLERIGLNDYNPLLIDDEADTDNDGLTDLEELYARTSPFRANPRASAPNPIPTPASTISPFTVMPNASSTAPNLPPSSGTTATSTTATTTAPTITDPLVSLPPAIYGTTSKVVTLAGAYQLAPNTTATKYEWDFTSDGTYDFISAWQGTVDYQYTNPGTYRAMFRITDNRDRQGWGTTTVYITGPAVPSGTTATTTPPILKLEASLPASWSGTTEKVITLAGAVKSLPTGTYINKYEWDYTTDGVWDYTSTWQGTVDYQYMKADTYTATFRITNTQGAQASATVTIIITSPVTSTPPATTTPPASDNTASSTTPTLPTSTGFTASLVSSISGTTAKVVTLSGAVSGLGAGNYTTKYEWDYTSDGVYDYISAGAIPQSSVDYKYPAPGTHTATFRATDNLGRQATASMTVYITSN